MTKKLPMSPDEPSTPAENPSHARPTAAICDAVLAGLGRPPGLYRVVVVSLWLNFYRVNVLVGPDPANVKIPHSYFVTAADDGGILAAVPHLTQVYH